MMLGLTTKKSEAKATIKVTLPKSMQMKGMPTIEELWFVSKETAKNAIQRLLGAGIHAKLV